MHYLKYHFVHHITIVTTIYLEQVLQQTAGKGINVYTHGEMLPAHGYPRLREFKHLVGHYGGAWQKQKAEFKDFPGSILMTSNCIVEPDRSYVNRIFTTNAVGVKGVTHLDAQGDLKELIKAAEKASGFMDTADVLKPTSAAAVYKVQLIMCEA